MATADIVNSCPHLTISPSDALGTHTVPGCRDDGEKKHKRKEGKKKQAGSSCKHRTRADGHQKIHHHHHLSLFGAAIGCSPHCVMIKVFKSARFLFNRQRPHALTDVIKRRYTFQYKIPPKWWGKKSRAFPLGRGPTSVVWISLEREATRVHCNSGHTSGQIFFNSVRQSRGF